VIDFPIGEIKGKYITRRVNGVEVYTINGVDYTNGSPAVARIIFTTRGLSALPLKLYKENLCPRHKNYTAKRKPRTNCETCWRAYDGQ